MRILLSLRHENIIDIKDFLCENTIHSLKDIYIIQVRSSFTSILSCTYLCQIKLQLDGRFATIQETDIHFICDILLLHVLLYDQYKNEGRNFSIRGFTKKSLRGNIEGYQALTVTCFI